MKLKIIILTVLIGWQYGFGLRIDTIYLRDSVKIIAEYDSSKNKQGKFQAIWMNGVTVYEGHFDNYKREGVHTSYKSRGGNVQRFHHFKNGRRNGPYAVYNDNDLIMQTGCYQNDRLHGLQTKFTRGGEFESVQSWRNGNLHGKVYKYFESGNISSIITYRNGIRHGLAQRFHKNGRLEFEGNYKDGFSSGVRFLYDESGQYLTGPHMVRTGKNIKQGAGYAKDGIPEGNWKAFNADGKVIQKFNYKNGVMDGEHDFLHPSGKVRQTHIYKMGAFVGKKTEKKLPPSPAAVKKIRKPYNMSNPASLLGEYKISLLKENQNDCNSDGPSILDEYSQRYMIINTLEPWDFHFYVKTCPDSLPCTENFPLAIDNEFSFDFVRESPIYGYITGVFKYKDSGAPLLESRFREGFHFYNKYGHVSLKKLQGDKIRIVSKTFFVPSDKEVYDEKAKMFRPDREPQCSERLVIIANRIKPYEK